MELDLQAVRALGRGRTWEKLLAEVQKQSDAAGKLDWVVSIDSTIARVHQHGATLSRDTGGCVESQESAGRAA